MIEKGYQILVGDANGADKAVQLAETAEYGLVLWDGKSKGTVKNVMNRALA